MDTTTTTPVTTERIDLSDFEFDVACECFWHGDEVASDEAASWTVHTLRACGCALTRPICDPCLAAINTAPARDYRCSRCYQVHHLRPADEIISQLRIKP